MHHHEFVRVSESTRALGMILEPSRTLVPSATLEQATVRYHGGDVCDVDGDDVRVTTGACHETQSGQHVRPV
jgi:hypothetical protein